MDENKYVEEAGLEKDKIDQPKDFTLETTSLVKRLRYRMPKILIVIFTFLIIRGFDHNIVFNPINSSTFLLISVLIVALIVIIYNVIKKTEAESYTSEREYKVVKFLHDVFDFVTVIPYLMLVITVVNMFFVSFSPISGSSMEPNFSDDEAVIFSHMSDTYERFDVIIIYVENYPEPYLIKRVIGLPGETIVIDNNEIYAGRNMENLTLIEQDFIDQEQVNTKCINPPGEYCTFVVEDDEYFVLGDNRDGYALDIVSGYSLDSRSFPNPGVNINDIFGKVIFTFKDYNIFN